MAAARVVNQSCRCGAVHLRISVPGPAAGTRVICYCADCQTAARLHDTAEDVLSPAGGSEIWQTTPDLIEIRSGVEQLKVIRLSPRGLLRWHAGCCGTPMINTLPNLKLPFAGVVLRHCELESFAEVMGPVRCHASTQSAVPGKGAPASDKGFARAGFLVLRRMAAALISRRAGSSPLRDAEGKPIAPVEVISKAARHAARPVHLT